jgi:hypothetical protein
MEPTDINDLTRAISLYGILVLPEGIPLGGEEYYLRSEEGKYYALFYIPPYWNPVYRDIAFMTVVTQTGFTKDTCEKIFQVTKARARYYWRQLATKGLVEVKVTPQENQG